MPVTEFATLEILSPLESSSVSNGFGSEVNDQIVPNAQSARPTLSSSPLRDHLKLVAERQSAVSGYPVVFFESVHSGSIFYLISGWTSVSAHHFWIESQANQELLALLTGIVGIKGLVHLDIDFDEMKGKLELESANESWKEGVLMVSEGNKEMPVQICTSLKCTWTREGGSLDDGDGSEERKETKMRYRFAWFPEGIGEDPSSKVGDEDEIMMMKRVKNLM